MPLKSYGLLRMAVTGLNDVIKNLKREMGEIEGGTVQGLRKVGLFVENESNEIVPQDKGVLINSSFSNADIVNGVPVARIGYTAKYAPIVHEMPTSFNYTKPGTGPKFLEKAVKNNVQAILGIIRKSARVK